MEATAKGVSKGILEKASETISKKLHGKHRIDLDAAFRSYLDKSYKKYSTVKTLLYKNELRKLRDFFVTPKLKKLNKETFALAQSSATVRSFLRGNFAIICGTGGIGKSMLMKHLFLSELEGNGSKFIPILFELKDINRQDGDYNLIDVIFEGMNILSKSTSKDAIEYALERGMFMILLDGLDEMDGDKIKAFTQKLNAFCDKYPDNNVMMSSRVIEGSGDFIPFEKFAVLEIMALDKGQAIKLIENLEFDEDTKQRFITALDGDSGLYEKHKEFASNPLLLTMMFLTYDDFAEIPSAPHQFYERAFETLLTMHDSTKAGYIRKRESRLNPSDFKKVFATFCCITYYENKFSFSKEDLNDYLNMVKKEVAKEGIGFDADKYINDLVNALCVLCKEGPTYSFSHRSFQEYFTAVYLKDQTDDIMEKRGLAIIKKDVGKAIIDKTFSMLYNMAKAKFEKNILLPILSEMESDFTKGDKYDFYFNKMISRISFPGDFMFVEPSYPFSSEYFLFCHTMSRFIPGNPLLEEDQRVREHLCDNETYKIYYFAENEEISHYKGQNHIFVGDDKVLYGLMRDTLAGRVILYISKARKALTKKYTATAADNDFYSV
ncbi:MAG: NACHT domain-containing protein [Defluviitaleaceae bacterium]|nr:NACHT domain-containing protein [Defluviitaleaceae bacterium]